MELRSIRFDGNQIVLDGYPHGATVHGIEGVLADKLKRLLVFRRELGCVQRWLGLVPQEPPATAEESDFGAALCDAALIAFCRCFDFDHPLKPLRPKQVFTPPQRADLERLRAVRNKKVGHERLLATGTYSLIVQNTDRVAIEAVAFSIDTPFAGMAEVELLRRLALAAFDWVAMEFERVAAEIVASHNVLPLSERASTGGFTIHITAPKDHFASGASSAGKRRR